MRLNLSVPMRTRRPLTRLCRTRRLLQVELLEGRSLLSVQILATLGDAIPGAGFRINDFEPSVINNNGAVLYGDDLGTTSDPSSFYGEGIFLRSHGQEFLLARSNASAPGGGTFDFSFLGPSTLNDQGDASFVFLLQPFGAPFGVNAGTYRFSHRTHTVTAVVLPGVTPAPGGGKFAGTSFGPSLNNQGDLLFAGIVPTDKGIHLADETYIGLGEGIFKADNRGHISRVVMPGDAAPRGGKFDYAAGPLVNDEGDVVFVGHVAGEEARVPGFPPQADLIAALGSLYVKDGATGRIKSIVHAGDPAPGGGVFRQALFPDINNEGDVLFTGDLTKAPDANQVLGVFLYSEGSIIPIARPGDSMPGGGHLVTASVVSAQIDLNNEGDVVFNAALDSHFHGNTANDTGLFEWSHGKVSLIARTGTVLPGVGTVGSLVTSVIVTPPPPITVPNSGATNNDRGQVLFSAELTDGRNVLLLDTPGEEGEEGGSARRFGTTPVGEKQTGSPATDGRSMDFFSDQTSLPFRLGEQGNFFAESTRNEVPAQIELGPRPKQLVLLAIPNAGDGFQQAPLALAAEVKGRVLDQIFAIFTDDLATVPVPLAI